MEGVAGETRRRMFEERSDGFVAAPRQPPPKGPWSAAKGRSTGGHHPDPATESRRLLEPRDRFQARPPPAKALARHCRNATLASRVF